MAAFLQTRHSHVGMYNQQWWLLVTYEVNQNQMFLFFFFNQGAAYFEDFIPSHQHPKLGDRVPIWNTWDCLEWWNLHSFPHYGSPGPRATRPVPGHSSASRQRWLRPGEGSNYRRAPGLLLRHEPEADRRAKGTWWDEWRHFCLIFVISCMWYNVLNVYHIYTVHMFEIV